MAFDKETRNALAKAVTACRRLLMADVTDQLRGTFGMHPDGTVLPLKDLRHLTEDQKEAAQALRDLLDHYAAAAAGTAAEKRKSAYERMVLEIAFTNLNRLAALRMCEERGLVLECVRKGPASDGFRMYEQLSGGALGTRFETYRLFLASLYDELAIDLGILFDRTTPQSAVFPTERCLEEVLAELNKAELAQLWKEDETIGWVYQYFNPPEERREMRDASQAPRNSRELAVRNQFFTPRYVVEFLTDNTLGRIWYEMRQGATGLKEQCRYLVRRPDEVFLGHMTVPGPDGYEDEGTIAAAKLLLEGTEETFADFDASRDGDVQRMICMSHAVNGYARHEAGTWDGLEPLAAKMRAGELKDLSTQDILDYLFLTCRADRHGGMGEVYSEQWFVAVCNEVRRRVLSSRNEDLPQEELLKQPVAILYRAKKDPRDLKILDPACGSGHFLLYCFDLLLTMYAEAWGDCDGPKSQATGRTLREDYTTLDELHRAAPELILRWNLHGIDIDPRALQIAALALWLRAQRAWQEQHVKAPDRPQVTKSNIVVAEPMPGEDDMRREFIESLRPRVLGQLVDALFDKMKLAGEAGSLLRIEEEIRDAIAEAKSQWLKAPRLEQQFLFPEIKKPQQLELRFDLAGVTDAAFWDQAEEQIVNALRAYAERVRHGDRLRKQLFAEDAARGFAFADIARMNPDVVLMNPPFGRRSEKSRSYYDRNFGTFKSDIGLAFADYFVSRLAAGGLLGILCSRTYLAGNSFNDWRRDVILCRHPLRVLLDLGIGVLDDALVETCATVIAADTTEKRGHYIRALEALDKHEALEQHFAGQRSLPEFTVSCDVLRELPMAIMAYWLPAGMAFQLRSTKTLLHVGAATKHGVQTTDDFQFMRLYWEVPCGTACREQRWPPLAKGGEYVPFSDDLHLCVDWLGGGARLKAYLAAKRLETQGSPDWTPWMNSHEDYFRPGLTFPARTTSDFCPRVLQKGCVFTASGQALLFPDLGWAYAYVVASFTRIFKIVVDAFVCSGDSSVSGSAANTYRTRLVNALPLPGDLADPVLQNLGRDAVLLARSQQSGDETSAFFAPPSASRFSSLRQMAAAYAKRRYHAAVKMMEIVWSAEAHVKPSFAITDDDVDRLYGPSPLRYTSTNVGPELEQLWGARLEKIVAIAVKRYGPRRQLTKKSFVGERRLELLCHILKVHPSAIVKKIDDLDAWADVYPDIGEDHVSVIVGCVMGRWDIGFATGVKVPGELLDPFDPLPACPPGLLREYEARAVGANSQEGSDPTVVSRDGILVDQQGHPEDIILRVRDALTVIWGDSANDVEQELCELLGITSLRDYFRSPNGFFRGHLSRYSDSRRNAPLYWPLSSASGSYTVWVYYHRLTDETLYRIVNKYIEPASGEIKQSIAKYEHQCMAATGREKARLQDQAKDARILLGELDDMREELLRVAALPYKPNLNDGVLINAAPLHKLFGHRPWANDTADCWRSLEKGEYDWSHMAYTIWPERVRNTCKKDLSIAIAHGLEDLYEGAMPSEKKERKPRSKKTAEDELEETDGDG